LEAPYNKSGLKHRMLLTDDQWTLSNNR